MTNTVISLKKSSTPSSAPDSLANGEIAINYADGVLYYKAANGTIASISSGSPSFGTVNANGTLLIADVVNDYLTINVGDNIEITGDAINDTLTITANLKVAFDHANAAFNTANAAGGDLTPANNWANTVGISANNYAGEMANAANAYAASLSPDLTPVFVVANGAYFNSNAAFDKANNALTSYDLTPANNWANTINTAIQTSFAAVNNYTISVGTAANNYAGDMANSVNSNMISANNYAGSMANSVNSNMISANNFAGSMANSSNSYAGVMANSVNSNMISANNYAGRMANSANIYGMSYANATILGANNFLGGLANNKLANVSISSPLTATFVTTTGNTVATVGLSSTTVVASTYGGATQVPYFAVDAYGRLTTAGNVAFSAGVTITDETAAATTYYPVLSNQTSGTETAANVSSTKLTFIPSTGTLSATIFNSTSDINKKDNIKSVENAINTIKQINGYTFKWKDNGRESIGVLAQEVERVLPCLVDTNGEGKSVNYNGIVTLLVEVVKEQQKEIEELKRLITENG